MSLKGRNILMIDDDSSMVELVEKILVNAGCSFKKAMDLKTGFEIIRVQSPHLIILDLMLGTESGFTFLERRSVDVKLGKIPLIVLSGVNDKKLVQQALYYANVDYLIKPLNAKLLLQKIRKNMLGLPAKRHIFEESASPVIEMGLYGTIDSINEVSCTVVSGIKIGEGVNVKIEDSFLNDFFGTNVQFAAINSGVFVGEGLFRSQLLFRGITEEQAKKIRSTKWKK